MTPKSVFSAVGFAITLTGCLMRDVKKGEQRGLNSPPVGKKATAGFEDCSGLPTAICAQTRNIESMRDHESRGVNLRLTDKKTFELCVELEPEEGVAGGTYCDPVTHEDFDAYLSPLKDVMDPDKTVEGYGCVIGEWPVRQRIQININDYGRVQLCGNYPTGGIIPGWAEYCEDVSERNPEAAKAMHQQISGMIVYAETCLEKMI
ncbi:MAG: hypothetical protein HYW02_03800, partial [Deltaproteobacteria bacterium]|nr:hypothetical protein [Deltaproteobacteria bacterium]